MSDKHFVDTNILLYAHDRSAGVKHDRARALLERVWTERSGVLSTQVLQEFCINARRRSAKPLSVADTRETIADYLAWEVVVNTSSAVLEALDLEERFEISFWDALIVHAAQTAGATILYSEDLSDGQMYGPVRVVNPLTDAASGSPARRTPIP
jgi:predicted nucleic acid-binding protein